MDNITHTLTGWALGQAGLKARTRKGLAALILGANMPDIDIFFGWVDWAPLAMHRGFTHGLTGGVLFLPPFLAGLLWLFDRWQMRRGEQFASGLEMRFGWLLALSYIGAATHPLLDLQNTYAVQLWSPFDDSWYHTDGLFIIDLWLWVGLGLGIWLSMRRERRGAHWQRPARIALAAAVAYIATNIVISILAKQALARHAPQLRPDALFAGHRPLVFWKRNLIWREQGRIGRAEYGLFSGIRFGQPTQADNMSDPIVRRAARANREVIDFLRWSVVPTARIVRSPCRAVVSFGDARFGSPRISARFLRTVALPLSGPGCKGA